MVHHGASQGDRCADLVARPDLEGSDGLAGPGDDGLLATDGREVPGGALHGPGVGQGFTQPDVQNDFLQSRHPHGVGETELPHHGRDDFVAVHIPQSGRRRRGGRDFHYRGRSRPASAAGAAWLPLLARALVSSGPLLALAPCSLRFRTRLLGLTPTALLFRIPRLARLFDALALRRTRLALPSTTLAGLAGGVAGFVIVLCHRSLPCTWNKL